METLKAVAVFVAGGLMTYLLQWASDRRTNKRADRLADEKARLEREAEWTALQIRTLVELQDAMEDTATSMATIVSGGTTDPRALMVPFSRCSMLVSRVGDPQLAEQIRTWLGQVRDSYSGSAADRRQASLARLDVHERIGVEIQQLHSATTP